MSDNPSAFPSAELNDDGSHHVSHVGMCLRDYFAGQALAGLLSSNATYGGRTDARNMLAADAYNHADAMLAARKAQP